MSYQIFLDNAKSKYKVDENILRILNWNVRNPSFKRAVKQCKYIENLKPHLILLTELKSVNSLKYFKERLSYLGYKVFYDLPNDDYFILVASIFDSFKLPIETDFLSHRMKGIIIKEKELKFIGIYVPSRGPKEMRNVNKRKFQYSVMKVLDKFERQTKIIIGGDLNVIDPFHIPKYPVFGDWEYEFYEKFIKIGLFDAFREVNNFQDYSWFGREGGYRFDHLFVSKDLKDKIKRCYYDHNVRKEKLSDHSSMILELEMI